MTLLLLLVVQAMGPEVTTYYPLPSKEQQQKELKQAQGLAAAPAPAPTAKAEKAKPEVPIQVMSVKAVPADANVVFQAAQPERKPK